MAKGKTKPLMPSLREKKRYLAYELISSEKFDALEINKSIMNNAKEFLGDFGMAKAGIIPMNDQHNTNKQRGVLRVAHKELDSVKASFIFLRKINNNSVILRSVGSSGVLKKVQQKYLN
ncbi:hypothetical protein ISS07_04085 [Candidatus Woesearchaeota archaeon]|nr:hypothetical protein [Candidatus Woesearchaeota archaeon]